MQIAYTIKASTDQEEQNTNTLELNTLKNKLQLPINYNILNVILDCYIKTLINDFIGSRSGVFFSKFINGWILNLGMFTYFAYKIRNKLPIKLGTY